eukprot:COSAG05_NODE_1121_length_5808_cov_2.774391_9_plen_241_part_00
MGVPLFFGWLRRRYPSIVQPVVDVLADDGVSCGARFLHPTPGTGYGSAAVRRDPSCLRASCAGGSAQGYSCDFLYLDMNGIIHQCTHPLDRPAPSSEGAMFADICRYIDRLVALTRPRKMVYMAIDGVAPRAKMNQQRARRFRAAMDAAATNGNVAEHEREEREARLKWAAEGLGGVSAGKPDKCVSAISPLSHSAVLQCRKMPRLFDSQCDSGCQRQMTDCARCAFVSWTNAITDSTRM